MSKSVQIFPKVEGMGKRGYRVRCGRQRTHIVYLFNCNEQSPHLRVSSNVSAVATGAEQGCEATYESLSLSPKVRHGRGEPSSASLNFAISFVRNVSHTIHSLCYAEVLLMSSHLYFWSSIKTLMSTNYLSAPSTVSVLCDV